MNLPSKLIDDAVSAFASFPGIGKKTALRLVLHLLRQRKEDVEQFGETILKMKREIRFCSICHNVSDQEICSICTNKARQQNTICVVENLRDLLAIENTGQYNGVYHILGGVISPVDGIGPEDLNMESLHERVRMNGYTELIMALSPTIEGDTTIFYITKKLADEEVKITTIARGIAFGGELEYVDDLTLARSIANRLPYQNYLVNK